MHKLDSENIRSDGIRFIGAGAANTLITLIIYQILLLTLSHNYAYSISWIIGVIFLMVVYPTRVFIDSKNSTKRKVAAAMSYLTVFIAGMWCLNILIGSGLHERLAIFVVVVFSALLNFFLMRFLLRGYFLNSSKQ